MRLPLLSWQLHADALPESLRPAPKQSGFSLPGLDALDGFSDLLGESAETSEAEQPAPGASSEADTPGAPFSLPGEIPIPGPVALTHEIDFRALCGDHARLSFSLLTGRGDVLLDGQRLASFENGPLDLDVTAALRRMRKQTLSLRFDETRPAGSPGTAALRVARHARFIDVMPVPGPDALTVRARIESFRAGEYVLTASVLAGQDTPAITRELSLRIGEGDRRNVEWALEIPLSDVPDARFVPGVPCEPPVLRVQLWLKARACAAVPGALCDEETRLFAAPESPARPPRWWLPLSEADCMQSPQALAERLSALHVPYAALPDNAPEALFPPLTRAGIGLCVPEETAKWFSRFPCFSAAGAEAETLWPGTAALAAWRLCSMPACPRTPDPALSPAELLSEAAGRPVDPDDPALADVLAWLHAVFVRLRAEAMRQGRCGGALCAPGVWTQEDIADALKAALAPVHLSVLPLYGAWWTGVHFSASLRAFAPEAEGPLQALVSLEDEDGCELARVACDCPAGGGRLGLIEASLPDFPCVLTLHAQLSRDGMTVEESAIPVYVGERGQLEAAFA